ncbi:unnamed protein product, partial [marine sediment metagenome]
SGSGVKDYYWSAWDDDDATYTTASRQYSTDDTETSGSITSACRDNVGNVDASPITITMTEDTTAPPLTDAMSDYSEVAMIPHDEWVYADISTNEFWFNGDESYGPIETVGFYATTSGDGSGSGVYAIEFGAWGGTSAYNDTASAYYGTYGIDGDESSGSITIKTFDNVGNSDSGSITVVEDNTAPSGGSFTTDYDLTDNTGDGYYPYQGTYGSYEAFYDQVSYTCDASGWSDSESGLNDEEIYRITSTGGSYGLWRTSPSNV